ncbi:MAG TPA: tetraacyldisaccharide 4'-kinase [Ottowia sp.]|uniref:tetraacyldisaccharide 4'-kinase n=1 Tax=Ottowia sp. TaxID=1898956 RepID=UPI002BF6E06E|nr:tetraacyldisaccharide 4'-kinase [Ottowia sp.]HMN21048.1 tetraacyldisaccharide 4'-kinase [Ottowia sp.]
MPAPAPEHRLRRAWTRRGPLACLLWPLSLAYGALAALHRGLYRLGWRRATRLPVPVIVVGNVVAGGAGKTPTTLALAAQLRARGWHPGIVSRGHGRRSTDTRAVESGADPRDVGDEPLLLRRRADVPVFVARRRADAGRALLARHPEVDLLLCDDGLQHLALARDVELCVFDARGVGNGWLLPAGPLREPWPRAVDLVLWTEPAPAAQLVRTQAAPDDRRVFASVRRLATHALRADGTRVALASLRGQRVTALAAIARPEAFFDMLRDAGLVLAAKLALPDHDPLDAITPAPDPLLPLVCTEKDAAKLWRRHPEAWAVPLELDLPAGLVEALVARLQSRQDPATTLNCDRT